MPRNVRYALLVVALIVADAILLAMLGSRWGIMDSERGHYERINGEVVWAYD